MPDCDYCGESFGSERGRDKHLKAEHADELGPIDRRRLDMEGDDESVLSGAAGPIALGVIILFAAAVIGFLVFSPGQSPEPHNLGGYHGHGTINMTVLGESPDFSRDRYQVQDRFFHFENRNGRIWHVHGEGVTLEYGMNTIDIGVTDDSVTYNGTTYEDSDPQYDVEVTVSGRNVNPSTYVLEGEGRTPVAGETSSDGHIRIIVTRAN